MKSTREELLHDMLPRIDHERRAGVVVAGTVLTAVGGAPICHAVTHQSHTDAFAALATAGVAVAVRPLACKESRNINCCGDVDRRKTDRLEQEECLIFFDVLAISLIKWVIDKMGQTRGPRPPFYQRLI